MVATEDETELMARFGVTKVPAYHYRYRDWRYSSLGDALAQARRDVAASAAAEAGRA